MKVNTVKKKEPAVRPNAMKPGVSKIPVILILPAGTKFSDIYMDAPQIAQELNIGKRTVRNMRVSGKLSFTNPFGKILYYRQEIAAILEANKILKKK